MKNKPESDSDLILYQTEDGRTRLQVRLEGETVWLSLNQMADLFQRDKSVISRHIGPMLRSRGSKIRSNGPLAAVFWVVPPVAETGATRLQRPVEIPTNPGRQAAHRSADWARGLRKPCQPEGSRREDGSILILDFD